MFKDLRLEDLSRGERVELESALKQAEQESSAEWSPSRGKDPFATCVDRRAFLRGGAALIGGLAISNAVGFHFSRAAFGAQVVGPYGAPEPTPDEATGLELIKLPPGFRYFSFGWTGDPMGDGIPTPALHDGTAVVRQLGRWLVIIRNHEVEAGAAFGESVYSPGGGGGTTNLIFDLKLERFIFDYASLSGTMRNCSGGVTPWGTWFTCEEVSPTTVSEGLPHGYVFEVGPNGARKHPEPIRAMGRFSHEAISVAPRTGIVYETEDGPSADTDTGSGFYRFIPRRYGRGIRNGKLQMLKVRGVSNLDFQPLGNDGQVFSVEWVDIPNPDPDVAAGEPSVFQQGFDAGGASFQRLEGTWYGDGKIYFDSTDGGPITASGEGEGQIFVYDPHRETLKIIFASADPRILENPDNLVVAPDGSLVLCEDNAGNTQVGGTGPFFNEGERLVILQPNGDAFNFAFNNLNFTSSGLGTYTRPDSGMPFDVDWRQTEWAGATFSPDGKWLFVHIQTPGITFAITGPWAWLKH
jgi:uncharacterized protein